MTNKTYCYYVREWNTKKYGFDIVGLYQEFALVFLENLSRLSRDYEIKFIIKLIPRTTLVFKAPYRMALAELKVLKTQLQVLLNKTYIWLSHSP